MFEPWQLGMIDEAGYNGIRDEHIDMVAESLSSAGMTVIDRNTFEHHCIMCGIEPSNFTKTDLEKLVRKLNEK